MLRCSCGELAVWTYIGEVNSSSSADLRLFSDRCNACYDALPPGERGVWQRHMTLREQDEVVQRAKERDPATVTKEQRLKSYLVQLGEQWVMIGVVVGAVDSTNPDGELTDDIIEAASVAVEHEVARRRESVDPVEKEPQEPGNTVQACEISAPFLLRLLSDEDAERIMRQQDERNGSAGGDSEDANDDLGHDKGRLS